jgi:hypothetical protein
MYFIKEIEHTAISNLLINTQLCSFCTEINHLPLCTDFLGSEKFFVNHINKDIFEGLEM